MKLLVGLGNPGKQYEKSRHNVGFMVLDHLRASLQIDRFKVDNKLSAEISKGDYLGEKIILAKPVTFMNLSGEAVKKTADYYKISPGDIIIVYDDLDLPVGRIRVKSEGGAGTHNGMRSVVSHIGKSFCRVRVGIEGRIAGIKDPEQTASYVLGRFSASESKIIKESIETSCEALKLLIEDKTEAAMNMFN